MAVIIGVSNACDQHMAHIDEQWAHLVQLGILSIVINCLASVPVSWLSSIF